MSSPEKPGEEAAAAADAPAAHREPPRPARLATTIFFIGSFVSMFGSDMNGTAVQWAVYERTGREDVLGAIMSLPVVAAILLLPYFGVLLDRYDRRRVAIFLDVTRGAAVFFTPLLLFFGGPWLAAVSVMVVVVNLFSSAYWPNASALVQEVSPRERHVRIASFFSAAIQGGTLVAGLLVGLLYKRIGLSGILLIDGFTYVVSTACLFVLRRGSYPPQAAGERLGQGAVAAFVRDVKEGLAFLRRENSIFRLGAVHGLLLAAVYGLQVVTAPINRDLFHSDALAFGFCNGAWGLGAIVGSQAARALFRRVRPAAVLAPALVGVALSCAAIPLFPSLGFGVAAFLGMGLGRGIAGVVIFSRFLSDVPRHVMGRVQSAIQALGLLLRVTLMLASGLVAEHFTLGWAVLLNAGLFLLAAFVAPPARERVARPAEVAGA